MRYLVQMRQVFFVLRIGMDDHNHIAISTFSIRGLNINLQVYIILMKAIMTVTKQVSHVYLFIL
jgi:hypothetical protein